MISSAKNPEFKDGKIYVSDFQWDNDEMIRIVKKYSGNFQEFYESWLKVIKKSPVEIVKELALAVYQFFMARETRSEKQWHPLSICPAQGSFLLCEHIVKKNFGQFIWLLIKDIWKYLFQF